LEQTIREIFDVSDSELTPISDDEQWAAPRRKISRLSIVTRARGDPPGEVSKEKPKKIKPETVKLPTNPFLKKIGASDSLDDGLVGDLEALRAAMPKKETTVTAMPTLKTRRRTKITRFGGSPPRNVVLVDIDNG
jgi:hypothetical protein